MATKNISRSIIEGGRAKRNKEDRYLSNKNHRANNREYAYKARTLTDADELGTAPKRDKVYKAFDDKLAPVFRWLGSQLGKKWDKVYSELRTKFDVRTTAGRHIVYDHMLGSIILQPTDRLHDVFGGRSWSKYNFYVDSKGFLRRYPRKQRNKDKLRRIDVSKWANGRRVMDHGTSLFWMEPARVEMKMCNGTMSTWPWLRCYATHQLHPVLVDVPKGQTLLACDKKNMQYREVGGERIYMREVKVKFCAQPVGPYKQGARLSKKDVEIWTKLDDYVKEELLWIRPPLKKRLHRPY